MLMAAGLSLADDLAVPKVAMVTRGLYQDANTVRPVAEPMASDDPRSWFKPLSQVDLNIRPPEGRFPVSTYDQFVAWDAQARAGQAPPDDRLVTYCWKPTEFSHQPLYFDDAPLERYGQTVCPVAAPLISGSKFFLTFPAMPYKLGLEKPYQRVTTLGYHRIGRCAPPTRQHIPLRLDAAMLESGAWIGFIFLLP